MNRRVLLPAEDADARRMSSGLPTRAACDVSDEGERTELDFLRETAEHSSLSDESLDLAQLAELVFPQLRRHVRAEQIVLVSAGRDKSACLVGRPLASCGAARLDARTCTTLVERYRGSVAQQPWIAHHRAADGNWPDAPAGLESFVLVPLCHRRVVVGWLLAVNSHGTAATAAAAPDGHWSTCGFGTREVNLLRATAAILAAHAANVELLHEKEQLLLDTVRALVNVVEAKDRYTSGHSERVGLYAKELAAATGLKESVCNRIYLAGLLHDIGKIAVRDDVLGKSAQLAREDLDEMHRHPEEAWSILFGLTALDDILFGVLHHHESWDGTGYPDGLRAEEIPLDARILAVADAYDAMTTNRPYRCALSPAEAADILRQGAGVQWDPRIVAMCVSILPTLCEIRESHHRQPPPVRRGYRMIHDELAATLLRDGDTVTTP
ncbi:MAG: HD-GYP domain-containing protein [Pirellulaceae bacterium]|nr:HD-GYP domain-containing protein [Pirellulaceae bacterium]